MTDSLDKIGAAVGLNRTAMLEILDGVKANNALLATCARHEFAQEHAGKLGSKWLCAACGGRVSTSDAYWYNLGRKHS